MNDKRNRSYLRVAAVSLAGAVMLSASASSAQTILGTFSTSREYDEQVTNEASPAGGTSGNFLNAVDVWAVSNNIAVDPVVTPAGPTSYAQFKVDIANAYDTNKGGVISFDNDTNAIGTGAQAFVALVGADQATQLTVTRTDGTINNNNNHNVISGLNYLGLTTASPCTLTFSRPLETFAITALGRGTNPTMTLTVFYDNATTFDFAPQSMGDGIGGGETSMDTLFAWKAPAGRTITSVRFVASAFVRYDDMAVILANFQEGDVDGDLDVDTDDYNLIRTNFGLTGATKAQGDVSGDGIVNLRDFQLWKANEAIAITPGTATVPEPSSLALGAIGLLAAVRRRRRR